MPKNSTKSTPKKRRTNGWQERFIAALREWPSVTQAAKEAGIERTTAYKYRQDNAGFAQQWAEAEREGVYSVEDEAWERTRQSDTMLIFMLKSHRPSIYRETFRVEHDIAGELLRLAERLNLSASDIASDPLLSAFFGAANVKVKDDTGQL